MRRLARLAALAVLPAAALAQTDKTQIDLKVRAWGTNDAFTDHLSVVHPDFSAVEVEVLAFYNRESGIGLASAIHSIVGSPYKPALGDAVTLLDRPDSALHPDGRIATFNFGGQAQAVYHTGATGIDANRFRIAAIDNESDLIAGGISVHQNTPQALIWTFNFDKINIPGFHFRLKVACAPDALPRTVNIDVPRDRVNTFNVYNPDGTFFSSLQSLLDTDPATVTISVPAPSVFAAAMMGAASVLAGRRSRTNP